MSDYPTVMREFNKLFTAIAANEGFSLMLIDIRVTFPQSKELKKEVFLVPPKDIMKQGILWKLKKPIYGLNIASRCFCLRVKDVLNHDKLNTLPADEPFNYKYEGGQIVGMVIMHVDDFQITGNNNFLRSLEEKLDKLLTFSKVERDMFRFTGIDVEKSHRRDFS